MADEELLDFIYHGREERNLEYKRSMNWQLPETKAKVTKSAMAMANIRDGGTIVFGVEQDGEAFTSKGMDPKDADSFGQDDVMEKVNEYADPYVQLTVSPVTHDDMRFVVIQVREFDQLPVVCKKDGLEGLKRGALFTRPLRKYETTQVGSQTEMREILDSALDKQLRSLSKRGLVSFAAVRLAEEADKEKFEQQLGGL